MDDDTQQITVTFVDPPEGWQYGFPKILPKSIDVEDISEWVWRQGYPCDVEMVLRIWDKTMPVSDLPESYFE